MEGTRKQVPPFKQYLLSFSLHSEKKESRKIKNSTEKVEKKKESMIVINRHHFNGHKVFQ